MRRFDIFLPVFLALAVPIVVASPATAQTALGISITIAPPALPIYVQPPLPAPGYIWTPGYWAYGDDGYYWVPGTWVEPPTVGLLWTPGYWGWNNGVYAFNGGYWGSQVGFYGGIDYGYGYGGSGYEGGHWDNGRLFYNSRANNFGGVHITNVYSRTVNNISNHVSFNGGNGGVSARPTQAQEAFAHQQHVAATPMQAQPQSVNIRSNETHGS